MIQIQVYDDSQKTVWDEFIRHSKNGTFLFLRDYMDYHRERFQDHSLIFRDDKKGLLALLPANRTHDTLVSHGGLTFGGLVTDEKMKMPLMLEVFDTLLGYLGTQGISRMIYKSIPYIYHRVPAEEDRYALFLCHAHFLRRGVLTVLNQQCRPPFQERRTRGVRKAKRQGLDVRESTDLRAFWSILSQVLAEVHNTRPVHSLAEIQLLHSRFPHNIRLFGCYEQSRMLAGVVIYESERVAHAQYIASSNQGREKGALDLLFDTLINNIYSDKPYFDFGTSDSYDGLSLDRGLIDQKEGFGARVVVHDHYEINLSDFQRDVARTLHSV